MSKNYFTILKEDCCGCHACEVACKQEHNMSVGPRLIRVIENSPSFVPLYCHHCADAPCKKACPVKAIERNEHGIVLVNEELCIGCRECVEACPFGAMQFDDSRERATKCDLCIARIQEGKAPACSLICPTGCIVWDKTETLLNKIVS